jgi:phosphoribosylformimino-5-aminoimidazole carboxamide ribotide isomerase
LGGPLPFFRVRHACESLGIVTEHVMGLESLSSSEESLSHLVQFCRGPFHPVPLIFSLDMKEGRPLAKHPAWQSLTPIDIAARVVQTGITRLIVLDLADVGTSGGTRTLDLCRELKRRQPQLELIAGGGVRNLDDLKRIADAGCSAALVASALHDGGLTRADFDAAALL